MTLLKYDDIIKKFMCPPPPPNPPFPSRLFNAKKPRLVRVNLNYGLIYYAIRFEMT